jgi:putative ABC transport system permease protein/macrolide transport system ATP-binding/permease protein
VRRISPVVSPKQTPIVQVKNRYTNASVKGVNADFVRINNDRVQVGRGIREADIRGRRPVALIGDEVVSDLFQGKENPVGQNIRISGREYRVIGILERKSRDLLSSIGSAGGGDVNSRILIPYTLVQALNGNTDINYLHAEAVSLKQAESAANQLVGVLARRYHGTLEYNSSTLASYLKTVNRILGGVTLMGIVAASTALLVGAIGVAGIMSTAVAERTREIGIRAAIGAHRWHIMTQFASEAILISLLGGLGGVFVGLSIGLILDVVAGFPLLPDIQGVLLALCVSIIVGLGAGYYPAKRAAQMKPVDALRIG